MARYIDADALEVRFGWMRKSNDFRERCGYTYIPYVLSSDIFSAPTADVAPVVHGRWIKLGQDILCSACGEKSAYNPFGASKFSRYCPNCGAKMDGGENE